MKHTHRNRKLCNKKQNMFPESHYDSVKPNAVLPSYMATTGAVRTAGNNSGLREGRPDLGSNHPTIHWLHK
jgi:hypothetical protein